MSLKITCKNRYNDKNYVVLVDTNATINDIRIGLSAQTKNKLDSLLLFMDDEYLQNFVSLSEYDIKDGAILIYEARLCGPLPVNYDWSKSGLKTKYSRFTIQNNTGKN